MNGGADQAYADPGKNSRGFGFALRVAGALVPIASTVALGFAPQDGWAARILRVVGYPWGGWGEGNGRLPVAFGAMGLVALAFTAVLLVRRDWRGATGILLWSLFVGFLISGPMMHS